MKLSINLFSKCDQIRKFLRIWSHLQKTSLMENFIFCAMWHFKNYLTWQKMCCLKLAWHVGLVRNNEYYFDSILGLSDHNIVPQTDCMDIYEHQSTKCSQGLLTLTPKNPLLWKASSFSYRSSVFLVKNRCQKKYLDKTLAAWGKL